MTMREILFRGKTICSEWAYGQLILVDLTPYDSLAKPSCIMVCNARAIGCGICVEEHDNPEVFPDTVGQFTGMTDKNGTKIFEGDLVRVEVAKIDFVAVCKFYSGSFGLVWHYMGAERYSAFTGMCNAEYEVIGNIHDNPDMMEDK